MYYFSSLLVLLSSLTHATPTSPHRLATRSDSGSAPNPIAAQYPNNVTGTINGTIAIVPIQYTLARSIIPPQYNILKEAYESLLPGFPADQYPLYVRPCLDHDIQLLAANFTLPDFQKVIIAYPFIDLLHDGYSSFTYSPYLVVSAASTAAQAGGAAYGEVPVPANFTPDGQAYEFAEQDCDEISFDAYTDVTSSQPTIVTRFKGTGGVGPWPLEAYINITNQPTFANGLACDNQLNLFNTSLSTAPNAPVGITGSITLNGPFAPCAGTETYRDVHGVKVDVAFIENNLVPCAQLRGYSGTGSGD